MNNLVGILFMLVVALIIVFIITLLLSPFILLFYRRSKKGNNQYKIKKITTLLGIVIILFSTYESYNIISIKESHIKNEFKHQTGIDFPEKILYSNRAPIFPDFRLDDDFEYIMKLNDFEYNKILHKIKQNKYFKIDTFNNVKFWYKLDDKPLKKTDFITYCKTNDQYIFVVTFIPKDKSIAFKKYCWGKQ